MKKEKRNGDSNGWLKLKMGGEETKYGRFFFLMMIAVFGRENGTYYKGTNQIIGLHFPNIIIWYKLN